LSRKIVVGLSHEAQVAGGEVRQVGEDAWQGCGADAKPCSECGGVLIEGGGRNPAPVLVGVVWTAKRERGESAVDVVTLDGAAENEVVAAPGVVRAAVRAGLEGAAELRESKTGDGVGDAEFLSGFVEGRHALADGGEQLNLLGELIAVGV